MNDIDARARERFLDPETTCDECGGPNPEWLVIGGRCLCAKCFLEDMKRIATSSERSEWWKRGESPPEWKS